MISDLGGNVSAIVAMVFDLCTNYSFGLIEIFEIGFSKLWIYGLATKC